MTLLLDLGNSRVKWGTVDTARVVAGRDAVPWDTHVADGLRAAWVSVPRPQAVWAASVVDGAREAAVAAAVLARFGQSVNWARTPAAACGVRNAYAEPGNLGMDRFLSMVAARAEGLAPCVIASAGTALALDALSGDGRHLGGLIAPGAGLMQQSVRGAAARVQPASVGRVLAIATRTDDALASGCWHACAALVDRFVAGVAGALGGSPRLLIGGGDAEQLRLLLEHAATGYPDAVLKGLAAWADAARAP